MYFDVGPNGTDPQQDQQQESSPVLSDIGLPNIRLTLIGEEAEYDNDDRYHNKNQDGDEEPQPKIRSIGTVCSRWTTVQEHCRCL